MTDFETWKLDYFCEFGHEPSDKVIGVWMQAREVRLKKEFEDASKEVFCEHSGAKVDE